VGTEGTSEDMTGQTVPPKHVSDRPFADPKVAMTRILQLAYALEREADNGRIPLGPINLTILAEGASVEEYRAGIDLAISQGYLQMHVAPTLC